jgi:hypothetical protein
MWMACVDKQAPGATNSAFSTPCISRYAGVEASLGSKPALQSGRSERK